MSQRRITDAVTTVAAVLILCGCAAGTVREIKPDAGSRAPAAAQQAASSLRQPARQPDVIYEPSPMEAVTAMLELAQVASNDVVYDLGSGDGRIVIMAAGKHGARGVGVDIDPVRIAEANENARQASVTNKVKFIEADLMEVDLSPANVITLFLSPDLNMKLRPKLQALKSGTRIVSYVHDMGDWKPTATVTVTAPRRRSVYLWIVS